MGREKAILPDAKRRREKTANRAACDILLSSPRTLRAMSGEIYNLDFTRGTQHETCDKHSFLSIGKPLRPRFRDKNSWCVVT